jgi:hypothetical protein
MEEREVDLNKILTPAPDAEQHLIKKDHKFGESKSCFFQLIKFYIVSYSWETPTFYQND